MQQESRSDSRRRRRVHFKLDDPEADQVNLFIRLGRTESRNYPMNKEDGSHTWTRTLLLPPGRYQYTFSVDGRWVSDPCNQRKIVQAGGVITSEILVYLPTTKEL